MNQLYNQYYDQGLRVISLGRAWNQPYSCGGWADLGASYPIIDDDLTQFFLKFGFGAVPQNVILDHTMQVRYSANAFNPQQIIIKFDQLISELPTVGTVPESIPSHIKLNLQAYPNPFNSSTMLEFNLLESGSTSLTIYDINGRQVAQIYHNLFLAKGKHRFRWTTNGIPSGIYFIHLNTATNSTKLKTQLLK